MSHKYVRMYFFLSFPKIMRNGESQVIYASFTAKQLDTQKITGN